MHTIGKVSATVLPLTAGKATYTLAILVDRVCKCVPVHKAITHDW